MDPMMQPQFKEVFLMLSAWGLVGWVVYLIASMIRRKQKNERVIFSVGSLQNQAERESC